MEIERLVETEAGGDREVGGDRDGERLVEMERLVVELVERGWWR